MTKLIPMFGLRRRSPSGCGRCGGGVKPAMDTRELGPRQGDQGDLRSVSGLRPDWSRRGRRVRDLRFLRHRLEGELGVALAGCRLHGRSIRPGLPSA